MVLNDREIEDPDGGVRFQPRTPAELAQIESLVRNAVGVMDARGYEISVVSTPFEKPPPPPQAEDDPVDVAGILLAAQRPLVALAGLAMALFLALRILGTLRAAPAGVTTVQQISPPLGAPSLPPEPRVATLPAEQPVFQLTDPDMTARVVRSWMKD